MMNNIQLLLAQHRVKALDIVNSYLEGFSTSHDEKTEDSLESYQAEVENKMYVRIAMDLTATYDRMDATPSDEDYQTGPIIMQEAKDAWFSGLNILRKQISDGHLR